MKAKPLFYLCGAYITPELAKEMISRGCDKYMVIDSKITITPAIPEYLGTLRKLWVDMCFDISAQTNRSVLFYGDSYADIYSGSSEEQLSDMHFITLICDEDVLRQRLKAKWGDFANKKVANGTWLDMAVTRNKYFKIYHDEHQFKNTFLIDITNMSVEEAADKVEEYINNQII